MNITTKEFNFGQHKVRLETGLIAKQATASVIASMDDTVVMVNLVAKKEADPAQSFFPLTVNYQEKEYAAGRIPGGYMKREGRPAEHEILIARLIDRPIRPLFPEEFKNEVQVTVTVLSANPDIEPSIISLLGTSAAIAISGVPFEETLGAAKIGYIDDKFILNPNLSQLENSKLDLVVAGTKNAILMVESEAKELPESIMLEAIMYGQQEFNKAIDAINEFAAEVNNEKWDWQAPEKDSDLFNKINELSRTQLEEAYRITNKTERYSKIKETLQATKATIQEQNEEISSLLIEENFHDIEKNIVRERILNNEPRIDGREYDMIRALDVRAKVLPRTHGSALFTRGETQALVASTLGSLKDGKSISTINKEYTENFMLHYNFPPYCVGETGGAMSPKRREIGHGNLAKRSIQAVLPSIEEFPYTVRVVSEITESNGSSSMASVCGTSIALMDAGVPIAKPVAGIAMGLVKQDEKYVVLSDILGDEDHLGDMDFKVAGTKDGVTALQMDIKIKGIDKPIMQQALSQAHAARNHILGVMTQALNEPRKELSKFAPKTYTLQVPAAKIKDVIGKGGATIRALTEEFNVNIDINDSGLVSVLSAEQDKAKQAIEKIKSITADVEIGKTYLGTVEKLADYGAFVQLLPGKTGLLHISQLSDEHVEDVNEHLKVEQKIEVVVLGMNKQGKIKLGLKKEGQDENQENAQNEGQSEE